MALAHINPPPSSTATAMAFAALRLPSFSLPTPRRPPHARTHRLPRPLPRLRHRPRPPSSLDVSKEDKPPTPEGEEAAPPEDPAENRRPEERFVVLNTGVYECRSCGYRYNRATGDPSYPVPPGLDFSKLPADWRCPTCGAAQSFFESKSVEIAGFAQNQQYGLGGNTLTSSQKALLIYGSLLLFFVLFLGGYFLQ